MDATRNLTWNEVHRQLVAMMRTDNHTNLRYLAFEYACLIAILGGCAWAWSAWTVGRMTTFAFVPAACAGIALVATFQHRLSGLAHEASHGTLFRDPLANELASDVLLMFPLVAMTQKYRAAHLGHHQYVNDPERDPDLIRLNHPHPHHFPISKAGFWRRYVLAALWPPTFLRYLLGRAKAANFDATTPSDSLHSVYRHRVGRCLRGTYWLVVLTCVHALRAWPVFGLFWVVPLLSVYPLLMQLREIAHHSNAPDAEDFTNSRVFHINPLLAAAIFPYGQSFHLTHHLFARVPHYRLPQAHTLLTRYPPYRADVVVCRGYFFRTPGTRGPSVLEVLAAARTPVGTAFRGPTRQRTVSEAVEHEGWRR